MRVDCLRIVCTVRAAAPAKMADALSNVSDVDIDPEGKFKYILVNIKVKGGTEQKVIVRGTKTAEYHSKCARSQVQ